MPVAAEGAVNGDSGLGQVDLWPCQAGEFGGPEAGEQAKRDVGQQQALFVVTGGDEQAAAVGKAENLRLGLVNLGAVDLVHRVGGGVFAADGPVKEVADGKAVVDLVAGRGARAEDKVVANRAGDVGNQLVGVKGLEHANPPA